MPKIFTLLLLLAAPLLSGQEKQGDGLGDKEFLVLKSRYSQMVRSADYHKMTDLAAEFGNKLKGSNLEVMKDDAKWAKWIRVNLDRTKFSSVAQADDMRQKAIASTARCMEAFPDVFKKMQKATFDQRLEVIKSERDYHFELIRSKKMPVR